MDADTQAPRKAPIAAWIGVAVFFALVGGLALALLGGEGVRDPMRGRPAPAIPVPLAAGSVPDGAHVVNFWATWCTPCIAEHPVLMEMADRGVPIVGVAYRDEPEKVARWLGRAGNPYSALHFDPEGLSLPLYGVRGVPETFVVGPDGTILQRISGALEEPVGISPPSAGGAG